MLKTLSLTTSVLVSALSMPVLGGQQPQQTTPVAAKQAGSHTLTITGILLKADGTPATATPVIAYPLDGGGSALAVNTMDKQGQMVLWNAQTKSGANGRFTLRVPHVSSIGEKTISSVGLGLSEPPGGLVSGTIWEITYADPAKEKTYAFVYEGKGVNLLRRGGEVLKVTYEQGPEADLGQVVIE
jgi:hypothetical protein